MNFQFVRNEDGWRLIDSETGRQFGEHFQELCRSPEWEAAHIVYEKYKRNFNLTHEDLLDLRDYIVEFSANRKAMGKKASPDFLVQEASRRLKEMYEIRKTNNLTNVDFLCMKDFIGEYLDNRKSMGKEANSDFLIQEASRRLKEMYEICKANSTT